MAKQSFTSEKYQAVIKLMNIAIQEGVSNDDLRQYVMKRFKPHHPGGNEGTLEGVAMTAKGLSTYIANVKAEYGLAKSDGAKTIATIVKRDTPIRSVCVVENGVVTKVAYINVNDMEGVVIPSNTVSIRGYQICGAPIGIIVDAEVKLTPEQTLVLAEATPTPPKKSK